VVAGIGWYFYYAQQYVGREGAIYHLFARLGKFRYDGLDSELHAILEEKSTGDDSDFDRLMARAPIIRLSEAKLYEDVVRDVADLLAERTDLPPDKIASGFLEGTQYSGTSVSHGTALPYFVTSGIDREELVMVQCQSGICVEFEQDDERDVEPVYAFFFLLSPKSDQSQHLRTQAALANRTDEESFLVEWRAANNEQEMKETLLHHERYVSFHLLSGTPTEEFIGKHVADLNMPAGNLVALVRRNGQIHIPNGSTALNEGDRITVIGDPAGIDRMYELYQRDTASLS
jgi:mannitol/fructose-specific phosphotransferase system IIA component (Ntr-type)